MRDVDWLNSFTNLIRRGYEATRLRGQYVRSTSVSSLDRGSSDDGIPTIEAAWSQRRTQGEVPPELRPTYHASVNKVVVDLWKRGRRGKK